MNASRHVLRFPGTLAGLQEASAALRGLLQARKLQDEPRYNVELVFEEIVTNIVRHGSPSGDVSVAVVFSEADTVLTFEDDGVAFDPCQRADPALPTSIHDATIGGLGVMMVRRISTRMEYERTPEGCNRLTVAIPNGA